MQETCPNHAHAHFLAFSHLEETAHFTCSRTSHLTLPAQSNASTAGCRIAHCASCMIGSNLLIHSTSQPFITTEKDKWEKTSGILLSLYIAAGKSCRSLESRAPSLQTLQYMADSHLAKDAGFGEMSCQPWISTSCRDANLLGVPSPEVMVGDTYSMFLSIKGALFRPPA